MKRKQSTTRAAARGIAMTWIGHGLSFLVSFLVTPFLISQLGKNGYGLWTVLASLAGYFAIISFGHGSASTKYIAQFDAAGDEEATRRLIASSFRISSVLAGITFLVALVASIFVPFFLDDGGYGDNHLRLMIFITGMMPVVQLIFQVYGNALVARRWFGLSNLIATLSQVATAICTATVVYFNGDVLAMTIVWLAVVTLTEVSIYIAAQWAVGMPAWPGWNAEGERIKELRSFARFAMFAQLARRLGVYAGSVLIGTISGLAHAGPYGLSESLVRRCAVLGRSMYQIVMPSASRLAAKADKTQIQDLLTIAPRVLLSMALALDILFIVLGYDFLKLWIDADLEHRDFAVYAYPILILLACAQTAKMPCEAFDAVLLGSGHASLQSRFAMIESCILIGAGLLFTWLFGPLGMASAVLLAQGIVSGIMLPWSVCRMHQISYRRQLLRYVPHAVLAVLPALILAIFFRFALPPAGVYYCLLEMGVVFALGMFGVLMVCVDRYRRREVIRAFLPKLRPSGRPNKTEAVLPASPSES